MEHKTFPPQRAAGCHEQRLVFQNQGDVERSEDIAEKISPEKEVKQLSEILNAAEEANERISGNLVLVEKIHATIQDGYSRARVVEVNSKGKIRGLARKLQQGYNDALEPHGLHVSVWSGDEVHLNVLRSPTRPDNRRIPEPVPGVPPASPYLVTPPAAPAAPAATTHIPVPSAPPAAPAAHPSPVPTIDTAKLDKLPLDVKAAVDFLPPSLKAAFVNILPDVANLLGETAERYIDLANKLPSDPAVLAACFDERGMVSDTASLADGPAKTFLQGLSPEQKQILRDIHNKMKVFEGFAGDTIKLSELPRLKALLKKEKDSATTERDRLLARGQLMLRGVNIDASKIDASKPADIPLVDLKIRPFVQLIGIICIIRGLLTKSEPSAAPLDDANRNKDEQDKKLHALTLKTDEAVKQADKAIADNFGNKRPALKAALEAIEAEYAQTRSMDRLGNTHEINVLKPKKAAYEAKLKIWAPMY
ncbi:MAG: hypothetical protein WC840_01780 [Candidatus Peribacteraceae bacterium]